MRISDWSSDVCSSDLQLELLLAETLSVAMRTEATTQAACERVTVDTTVQTKAVAHPTDSHLLMRGIEWLTRLAKRNGIKLRQSFQIGRASCRERVCQCV